MNKAKTRKEKALETKKRIYETAYELFNKYGFDGVSVDTIVETVGVSKGSFYVHFSSKGALIAELSVDLIKNLDLNYKAYIDALPPSTPDSDKLIMLGGKIARMIAFDLGYDLIKCTYEALITKTVNVGATLGYNRELYKLISDILLRGITQGEFKPNTDIDVVTNHLVMSLRGITYEWCVRHPDFDLVINAERHFALIIEGLKRV